MDLHCHMTILQFRVPEILMSCDPRFAVFQGRGAPPIFSGYRGEVLISKFSLGYPAPRFLFLFYFARIV